MYNILIGLDEGLLNAIILTDVQKAFDIMNCEKVLRYFSRYFRISEV